ncbi:MAG TPA: VanZ family protein [Longimicrobiales bacterium]
MSDLHGPTVDLPVDKLAHFFLYGILGALAARGWQRSGRRPGWGWPILAIWLLGAWDEWRQREVAGRSSDVADWVADAAGSLAAFALIRAMAGKARERGGDEPESIDLAP